MHDFLIFLISEHPNSFPFFQLKKKKYSKKSFEPKKSCTIEHLSCTKKFYRARIVKSCTIFSVHDIVHDFFRDFEPWFHSLLTRVYSYKLGIKTNINGFPKQKQVLIFFLDRKYLLCKRSVGHPGMHPWYQLKSQLQPSFTTDDFPERRSYAYIPDKYLFISI